MKRVCLLAWRIAPALILASTALLRAQQLPEDVGHDETQRLCKQCHELARSISLRQDRAGWGNTVTKMSAYGMKATDKEVTLVTDYLAKHFPADEVPRLNVNTASQIELESALSLRRSQAAALIAYREKNGPFKGIDDLKKVPNMDAAKLEAKKDRITY